MRLIEHSPLSQLAALCSTQQGSTFTVRILSRCLARGSLEAEAGNGCNTPSFAPQRSHSLDAMGQPGGEQRGGVDGGEVEGVSRCWPESGGRRPDETFGTSPEGKRSRWAGRQRPAPQRDPRLRTHLGPSTNDGRLHGRVLCWRRKLAGRAGVKGVRPGVMVRRRREDGAGGVLLNSPLHLQSDYKHTQLLM